MNVHFKNKQLHDRQTNTSVAMEKCLPINSSYLTISQLQAITVFAVVTVLQISDTPADCWVCSWHWV